MITVYIYPSISSDGGNGSALVTPFTNKYFSTAYE